MWRDLPDEMERGLIQHNHILEKTILRNKGQIIRTMGDAFMVYCPGKKGYEKAFDIAVKMMKAIDRTPIYVGNEQLRIRIGFCQGPLKIVTTRYQGFELMDFMSSTPNIASRMESKVSIPGTIAFCFWRVPIPEKFIEKISKKYKLYSTDFRDSCLSERETMFDKCGDPEVLHGVPTVKAYFLQVN